MRRILVIFLALAVFTPWALAAEPNFDEDLQAIVESEDLRYLSGVLPPEWENNQHALAVRARVLEDAANRVAARLDVDVAQLLQMPLEQQIRDADDRDVTKVLMLALALGHAGQDEATRAGLWLLLSRSGNPFSFNGRVAFILLAPARSEDVWDAVIPILNDGASDPGSVLSLLSLYFPLDEDLIQTITAELRPELVAPLSLVALANSIENPMEVPPGQRMRPRFDEPQSIPLPILDRIQNNWREIPPFAGWVAHRSDIPQETRDEALRAFLQWEFVFPDAVMSGESAYAYASVSLMMMQDHTRQIIEDAIAEEHCSRSMALVVMERLEAEKASKTWMEQNPDLVPVRDEHGG
jgi:hypothetical protein